METTRPILTGRTAFAGEATGRVKIIVTSADRDQVEVGDILVTAMTDPDMVPAMERAAAIITDRGGVTCHAANVSRELKKPCIVGTRVASEVLKKYNNIRVTATRKSGDVFAN
jgi:pyruvate,water dikinase